MGPIRSALLCKTSAIRVNERISENNGEWGTGRAYIRMGKLGHVTWLSAKMVAK